jgi:hypothetical protein
VAAGALADAATAIRDGDDFSVLMPPPELREWLRG